MGRVRRLWYVLCDGRRTHRTAAVERIVWRLPYNEQDVGKGGV